jgi:hypothetical protein
MLKSVEIRRQIAQRLRELFPKAKGWEESAELRGAPVGTVKTQMRAALIKLKKVLNPDVSGTEERKEKGEPGA